MNRLQYSRLDLLQQYHTTRPSPAVIDSVRHLGLCYLLSAYCARRRESADAALAAWKRSAVRWLLSWVPFRTLPTAAAELRTSSVE